MIMQRMKRSRHPVERGKTHGVVFVAQVQSVFINSGLTDTVLRSPYVSFGVKRKD